MFKKKRGPRDFPGGAVVKNLPANAGDMGSTPGPGRSHMPQSNEARAPQLLSLRATTTEAHARRARALPTREATAMRSASTTTKSSPPSLQLGKTHVQQQRPNAVPPPKKMT